MSKNDKTSVTQKISDYMREQIANNKWKLNQRIPTEAALCSELEVSRASIRSVISQFIALGILKAYRGKGTYLVSNDLNKRVSAGVQQMLNQSESDNLASFLEYRLLVEPQAILWLERATTETYDKLITDLLAVQQQMKDEVGESEKFIVSDMKFHLLIAKASGNSALYASLTFIIEHTMPSHAKVNHLFGFKDGLLYHQLIIDCLIHRDFSMASSFMAKHLKNAIFKLENQHK